MLISTLQHQFNGAKQCGCRIDYTYGITWHLTHQISVLRSKSYIEHPSSIEVTLSLPFYFVFNERISLTLVGGDILKRTKFSTKFLELEFALVIYFSR